MSEAAQRIWFGGPYEVVHGVDGLAAKTRLQRGELLRHRAGCVVLRCPQCNALGFAAGEIQGPRDAPTVDRLIHCGCESCDAKYRIRSGKAVREN